MRTYFIIGLIISLLLVFALCRLLFSLLRVNWNNNNTKWFTYLFPVVISILIAWTAITQLYPRLLDVVHLANGQYELIEVELAEENIKFNRIEIDGTKYYHMPFAYSWPSNEKLQILSSPNMNYIIGYTAVEEGTEEIAAPLIAPND
ncbi:MAG TPA: hypothetical protein GXZ59_00835 [Clostridiaceae bacterium]|nr:hypothetical protein [Clostridiaceae bacterium]